MSLDSSSSSSRNNSIREGKTEEEGKKVFRIETKGKKSGAIILWH